MEARALSPAAWLGTRTSGDLVSFASLGIAASAELEDYARSAEAPAFRRGIGAILETQCYWGVGPIRPPKSLFRESASSVVAFLAGASVLATDPDAGAALIAAWSYDALGAAVPAARTPGTPSDTSPVASFLFDDVSPSDPEPLDFVVEAPSIADLLARYGESGGRPRRATPYAKAFARLYRRGIWITHVVHDDPAEVDDVVRSARDASPKKLYAKERDAFATAPHLAAYWILAHALVGDEAALGDALERARDVAHPVVVDLITKLAGKDAKKRDALFTKHRPDWTAEDWAAIRAAARR